MNFDIQKMLTESPFLAIFAVFLAGIIASLGSCTLIRIPLVFGYIVGYSDSKRKGIFLLVFFVIGLILSYTILGVLLSLIGKFPLHLVNFGKYFFWILGVLLIIMGFISSGLFGLRLLNLHSHISSGSKVINAFGAFILGASLALIEMPACPDEPSVPLIIASTVFASGSYFYAIIAFISFAMGQSVPMLIIGALTTLIKYITPQIARYEPVIRLVAGSILIAIGIYFFVIA
jgi:cytochrome c-type biogenesis protein